MKHILFIEARVKYLRHDVELMVVVLSGLGQLRSDIEFPVLDETIAGGPDGPTAFCRLLLCCGPFPTDGLPDDVGKYKNGVATRPRGCATHRRARSVCKSSRKTYS
jgi:hypothetical protein